jgi:hypothetical protein
MGATSYVRDNVFDNSGSNLTQGHAIYYQGAYSSGNTATSASNLFIEDNHFDGYTVAGVVLQTTGTATVRRNTFGAAHASAATKPEETKAEETVPSEVGKKALLHNYGAYANRKALTWYPEAASVTEDCQLQAKVTKPSSGTLPMDPVTIDFYYTAGVTAEEYLGSVPVGQEVAAGGSVVVTVPNLPSKAAGYLRVQTQGYSPAGQPESSQYSRTVALPADPNGCFTPHMEIDLRAWRGVGADTSHDAITAAGGGAKEIPDNGSLEAGETIWFTYTVKNTGWVRLRQVRVRDDFSQPVCVIAEIGVGQQAGCSQKHVVPSGVPG